MLALQKSLSKKITFVLILNLMFAVLFTSSFFSENFETLESKALELAFHLRGQIAPSKVVIIEIDEVIPPEINRI